MTSQHPVIQCLTKDERPALEPSQLYLERFNLARAVPARKRKRDVLGLGVSREYL